MGGMGSGRWTWHTTKATVESRNSLDVRQLKRGGFLEPGRFVSWGWKDNEGRPVASIHIQAASDAVALVYRVQDEKVSQCVPLEWTSCNYGGQRPWFLCPSCAGRVAKLYFHRSRFRCRKCQDLAYASQREEACYRLRRKARKLRNSIGPTREGGRYPRKPKRMRWKTFVRKIRTIQDLELRADAAFCAEVSKLLGSLSLRLG